MKKLILITISFFISISTFAQSQFASSVISFSTQWGTTSWSAAQTTGAPNTVGCGDITTSWASQSADGIREFLELSYSTPQTVNTVNVYETYNPGAIDTIFLRNSSNGQWNIVYTTTAAPALPCPRTFTTSFTTTLYTVDAIRLAINSPAVASWNEIDAVEISNGITSVNNQVLNLNFNVYPNPSNGKFTVETKNTEGTIEILNLLGEMIYRSDISNMSSEIDLTSQPNGVYFLQIRSEKGVQTKKIIKD